MLLVFLDVELRHFKLKFLSLCFVLILCLEGPKVAQF